MKHPFSDICELTQTDIECASGAFNYQTPPADFTLDKTGRDLKQRPDFATTLAIGEEGGAFPEPDYF